MKHQRLPLVTQELCDNKGEEDIDPHRLQVNINIH